MTQFVEKRTFLGSESLQRAFRQARRVPDNECMPLAVLARFLVSYVTMFHSCTFIIHLEFIDQAKMNIAAALLRYRASRYWRCSHIRLLVTDRCTFCLRREVNRVVAELSIGRSIIVGGKSRKIVTKATAARNGYRRLQLRSR